MFKVGYIQSIVVWGESLLPGPGNEAVVKERKFGIVPEFQFFGKHIFLGILHEGMVRDFFDDFVLIANLFGNFNADVDGVSPHLIGEVVPEGEGASAVISEVEYIHVGQWFACRSIGLLYHFVPPESPQGSQHLRLKTNNSLPC